MGRPDDAPEPTSAGIDRRDAIARLGALGLGGAVASSLLGAAPSEARAHKPFRILSFCGGGIRGIASAGMLRRLIQKAPHVVARADLLAGTSVGSTIVSGLVANLTPDQVYEGLITGGPTLYVNKNTDPTKPAFDVDKLASQQLQLHPGNPPLRQLPRKVLFTSFDVGGPNRPWGPLLFNNLSKSTNAGTPVVDAVVGSAAMPGMLGSYKGRIDGAFVNHDPTLAAIALAVNEGVRLEDISVVCFGTGLMRAWIASDTASWGAQQWQAGDGNPADHTPPALVNGTNSPILTAALDGPSTNLTPHMAEMLLGSRYAYLNPTLDRTIAEDDIDPADLAYLEAQAAQVDIARAVRVVERHWR